MFADAGSDSLEFEGSENSLSVLVEFLEDLLKAGFVVGVSIEAEDFEEGCEVDFSLVA